MGRFEVNENLLDELKTAYPEVGGLTYTGLIEWAVRKAIKEAT